jgi:hypothetical protein
MVGKTLPKISSLLEGTIILKSYAHGCTDSGDRPSDSSFLLECKYRGLQIQRQMLTAMILLAIFYLPRMEDVTCLRIRSQHFIK